MVSLCRMNRIIHFLVEAVFWFQLFFSHLILGGIIAFIVYNNNAAHELPAIFILLSGFILGIVFAERIRRRWGCSRYLSRMLSTPDIQPTSDESPDQTK